MIDLLDLRAFLAAGAIAGGSAYIVRRLLAKKKVNLGPLMEAALAGAGIPGGLHLVLCAFAPDHLVHIANADQFPLEQRQSLRVELGEWHTVEIAVGGLAIAVLMVHVFWAACKK